jgi:hypothetical protein
MTVGQPIDRPDHKHLSQLSFHPDGTALGSLLRSARSQSIQPTAFRGQTDS